LSIEGYLVIYKVAEPWLKLAMDISLSTMAGRNEVCDMQHADFRGDYLFLIRKKTSSKSKEAFMRYPVNAVLRELRAREARRKLSRWESLRNTSIASLNYRPAHKPDSVRMAKRRAHLMVVIFRCRAMPP
jgi:hypothetical protein